MPDAKDSQKLSPQSESINKRHQKSKAKPSESGGAAGVLLSINSLTDSPQEMGNSSGPPEAASTTTENNGSKEEETDDEPLIKLQLELSHAKLQLQEKDDKIEDLTKVRDKIEAELRDLTASLFEEAHKMVREANVKQASAEKKVTEAQMKMEGLTTEVQALKVMVLTSTPSAPNKHLHPQIDPKKNKVNGTLNGGTSFHRRNDSTASSERDDSLQSIDMTPDSESSFIIDPKLYSEYLAWKKSPSLDRSSHVFLERIYKEDFEEACQFENLNLQDALFKSIQENALSIHPISRNQVQTKECTLLKVELPCHYQVRIENEESNLSFDISSLARNRIIAVCDALNYLRYVTQGLVKSSDEDVFTEVMQHRRKILLARLGFKSQ